VREQAFRVVKGFLSKLEKVSDDPTLKEEMEKEVGSTNSAVVAAAAGWANWAVGAVTAKFYKSPPAPTQSSSSSSSSETKEKTPDKSLSESMNRSHISDASSNSNVKPSDNGGGWDDADDEGWGDLNEKADDNKTDGWDDNDDWGSLEESSGKTTAQKEPTSASYDWGGGFNQATKTHDAFADLKPSNSDNLMAGPGGWDDWGAGGAAGAVDDKEEAKRKREEKRLERQKELEAKRAAKKGPMKLGGKKMID